MALRLSGRLSMAQAMPSWMRTLTNSYLYSAMAVSFPVPLPSLAHALVGEPATTPDQVRGRLSPGHALTVGAQHVPRERHLEDLDRALGDHHAALVAPEFLDRQVGGEPDAAMDLEAAVGGAERLRIAEDLRHIGLGTDVAALIVLPGGLVDHQAKLVQLHEAVDQHPLHRLPVGQRRAERHPLLGIARAELEAALDHAHAARAVA